jgi:repressor LexA
MKAPLTEQQEKILAFIQDHIAGQGHPPTFREICGAFGFRSTGTARDHLRALVAKGHLKPSQHKARSLVPVNPAQMWRGADRLIPVLGRVPAGGPLLAEENIEGSVDLSRDFGGAKVFALKVRGDSMIEAGIFEGDLVVVRSQEKAEPRDIVVALVDGEATVKRLAGQGRQLVLMPANKRYEPIPVTSDTKILGKVIGVIRSYERRY